MDAEAEGQVLASAFAVDDVTIRIRDNRLVAVARDVPHDDLFAFADQLAADFDVARCGAPHMSERCLPADGFRHHVGDQARICSQLGVFFRKLVECHDTAAHAVAGGVVAANDQQDDVAEIFFRAHVAGGLAMREHGDEVSLRRRVDPLVPELCEGGQAFHQLGALCLRGLDEFTGSRNGRGDIGPVCELAAALEGIIEQCGQHLRRQFD